MITKNNFENMLKILGFKKSKNIYEKEYKNLDCNICIDFENEKILYPESKGMKITHHTTCNFSDPENFVVLECVNRLLEKGYRPNHIELEKEWTLGHTAKGGRADICVYDENKKMLFIIECKTYGKEYSKELKNITIDGGQIFSYWQQERNCQYIALYSSTFENNSVQYKTETINCNDDINIEILAKKDSSILLYKDAHTVTELFNVWSETYEKRFCGNIIFRDDSLAYKIGIKPLRKKDLKDFSENDKIVNKFEEILRHNNVSDKENAFNRLIALFICKLVDEIQKTDNDVVDFQYKSGTDTYESLQDRLQRLHKEGMEKFMREKIFYVADDYPEQLLQTYTGQKRNLMIEELKKTIRILKFYTNNDFAFKDVHNEDLFYQNGKILVEVVQLFENFRIIGSNNLQMLGDLFEQLLNKGFKQNEGQFFTPIPITRFIWDSLPLTKMLQQDNYLEYPKIIDYACGAGHFLTEGFEAINTIIKTFPSSDNNKSWIENKIFGIEKDYRLARVSKISLFMHGAGNGNIIFGDGLENYPDKNILEHSFDILVANPPYSVSAFKPHLNLKNNTLKILDKISIQGSEIETLFVERISQLLKPQGIAAVILPNSILNKENNSFIAARELLLQNFYIRAIVQLGSKTFGATATSTVVLFLEKFNEPPKKFNLILDSINAIFSKEHLEDWEDKDILHNYLLKINISYDIYYTFISKTKDYTYWQNQPYFNKYYLEFENSNIVNDKRKQKSFNALSSSEKLTWYNNYFYDFAMTIEQEKLKYFALIYKQKTLIVTAPIDNKEQESFLGYSWSNRKGQEGIQIKQLGGKLFDPKNRLGENCISSLIRNMFNNQEIHIDAISKYYYYLKTQDMLDFNTIHFNKIIKTSKPKNFKYIPNSTIYSLDDSKNFELSIGNRVLSSDIVEDGTIPVYSANVFEEFGRINKKLLTDFSIPSIIWGIDGDWMVNYIPEGKEFYPTDHCGVLRVKTDKILPLYMLYALKSEGDSERFSRSNRASIQKISTLRIQIPSLDIQKEIVENLTYIDKQIKFENEKLAKFDKNIKSKFDDLFHNITNQIRLGEYCLIEKGSTLTQAESKSGNIPVIAGGTTPNCYHNTANRPGNIITISASGANAGYVNWWKEPIFATDCNTINSKNHKILNNLYVYYALLSIQDKIYSFQKGASQPHVYGKDLQTLTIPFPPIELQNEFINFVEEIDKLKFECTTKLKTLNNQKEKILSDNF